MWSKQLLCVVTVSSILSGNLIITRPVKAQANISDFSSDSIDEIISTRPRESDVLKQSTGSSIMSPLDQTIEHRDIENSLESVSSTQDASEDSVESSKQPDRKSTEETTSSETSSSQTSFTDYSTEIQENYSDEKQTNGKVTEAGWTYILQDGYAYITSSDVSGDVKVPDTLGGKPIRFKNLDNSVFVNYKNITSLTVDAPFYVDSVTFHSWDSLESIDLNLISVGNNSTSRMFEGCNQLRSINLNNFDTSSITDMSYMFAGCINLIRLNVSKFETANVIDMSSMFIDCYSLTSLDVTSWNTSNVVNMNGMFSFCNKLTNIDVSNWDTSKVNSMINLFYNCNSLTSLNVSKWDTSRVVNMEGLFSACISLSSIDVTKWDTSNVNNMSNMFSYCYALTSLDLSNFNTTNVTDMSYMFDSCPNFISLNATNWDTSNVINMKGMFRGKAYDPDQILNVQTNDQNLFNYNYGEDNRVPYGPNFDSDGGMFPDGTSNAKSYFSKIAMTPDEYKNKTILSSLKEYLKNNEPTKELNNFLLWRDSSGKSTENITNVLDEITTTYTANWQSIIIPNIPDGSTLPDNVSPQSRLGIAYYPTKLTIPKTKLNESGEQLIPIQTTSLHIGVKDQSAVTSWTLRAQVIWDKNDLSGSSILTENLGNVCKNENNGFDSFKEEDLEDTSEVTGEKRVSINETEALIMSATNDKRIGVYDYSLEKLTLVIPEVKYLQPNQYSGSIQWNLVSAP